MSSLLFRMLSLAAAITTLVACSSGPGSRIDYQEARSLSGLEVPPGLGMPTDVDVARLPQGVPSVHGGAPTGRGAVLPMVDGIRVERDGSARWLVVDVPAGSLWPLLRDFWGTLGLTVHRDEPQWGIMETGWAENRADVRGGWARSARTRDRYRLRLEPREDGKTEIHVTHYGLEEVVAVQWSEFMETAWTRRPMDPELVHEVLNRLIVHLGGEQEQALMSQLADREEVATPRTRVVADTLHVSEGFARTWRRTGVALDEAGLIVEDRNYSQGIYYVADFGTLVTGREGRERRGSLFGRAAEEGDKVSWQVVLKGDEQATRIVVRDAAGAALPAEQAKMILDKLAELLR